MTYDDAKDEAMRLLDDTDLEWQCFEAWFITWIKRLFLLYLAITLFGFYMVPSWPVRIGTGTSAVLVAINYRRFMKKWRHRG